MSEGSNHELQVPPKLRIPRPEFTVDSDNDDLELWSFRLPTNVPLSKLNGMAIDLKNNEGKFKVGDVDYKIVLGDSVENEAFRVLVPASESSEEADDDESMEDSDDEEGPQKYLQASSLPFTKHWNIVSAFPQRTERELAPREGPTPVDKIRHAYCHVPQRTGLKRRWMPMGVKADKSLASIDPMLSTSTTPSKSTNSKSSSSIKKGKGTPISPGETDMDTSTPASKRIKVEPAMIKSEKKASKAERKSAKKAKKEAKKLKEKRKSK